MNLKTLYDFLKKYLRKIVLYIRSKNEKIYFKKLRKRNKNPNPTIIGNNCIAGVIYHNLGIKYYSPTINLYFSNDGKEYLDFVRDIKYYSTCQMEDITEEENKPFPVGRLIPKDSTHNPVRVYFMHYKTYEQAHKKWVERFKRVNYDNIFYLWEVYNDNDAFDESLVKTFDKLPLKKMSLLHKNIDGLEHSFILKCYEKDYAVAKVLLHKGFLRISAKRNLDDFDYVSFLNS